MAGNELPGAADLDAVQLWRAACMVAVPGSRLCGRRVAILYGGKVYACRHCYRLAYRCQREASDDRATRQADKLRDRLGWEAGILNGNGCKPKGMHWRTFDRLETRHDALVNESLAGAFEKFGSLHAMLG